MALLYKIHFDIVQIENFPQRSKIFDFLGIEIVTDWSKQENRLELSSQANFHE